ncbi:MAG: hypothetical protein KBD24_03285 [Candidatus Pacebacteria bacterium]|nr:hypothetical protein [Candidatus Paceibacterota bacterium]
MRTLPTVTLLGIDCVNIERLMLVADLCQEYFAFGDVKLLTSLPVPTGVPKVEIPPICSSAEYSEFVIRHLAEYVDTSHVLIIQYDGFILNPDAWDDAFLTYDYIGAPWFVRDSSINRFGFPEDSRGTWVVGNGGFSLRSKKFLQVTAELAKKGAIAEYHPEDVSLCVWNRTLLEERGLQFAPVPIARRFSYEALDENNNRAWTNQLGFHGIRWTDISKWSLQHPEYVVDMQANMFHKLGA